MMMRDSEQLSLFVIIRSLTRSKPSARALAACTKMTSGLTEVAFCIYYLLLYNNYVLQKAKRRDKLPGNEESLKP